MSDLVERVARQHYEQEIRRRGEKSWNDLSPGVRQGFCGIASPFVAIALEEAAKVADDNNLWPAWRIAAAIRGMMKD
jgi:hypothetical protein